MAKVKLHTEGRTYGGTAAYDEYHLSSCSKNPYDMDRWFFDFDLFTIKCAADKQIIEVNGYLPHMRWHREESIVIPRHLPGTNFVIDEEFDSSSRSLNEEATLRAVFSPRQAVVKISVVDLGEAHTDKTFVSPHDNLLVGATSGYPMVLTDLILLNVSGVSDL